MTDSDGQSSEMAAADSDPGVHIPAKASPLAKLLQVVMIVELVGLGISYFWGMRYGSVLGQIPILYVVLCCVLLVGLPAAVYFALMRSGQASQLQLVLVFAGAGTIAASQLPHLYNCAAEQGPEQVYRTKVVDIAPAGDEDTWVEVKSWVRPGETVDLDAGGAYHSLALNSTVEVGVRPGALGAPWVSSLRIVREPIQIPGLDMDFKLPESLPKDSLPKDSQDTTR